MNQTHSSVEEILQEWQKRFGRLTRDEIKSFKLNKNTIALTKYDIKAIKKAIYAGGRIYLQDILEYLHNLDIEKAKSVTDKSSPKLILKGSGLSTPVLITRECGHRYPCTCYDAFSVIKPLQKAA